MENMQYAEELVREFIVFRGFTNTLQVFERELSTDIGRSFQVDKIIELVFSVYVPKHQADKLVSLLSFFKQCFSSSSDVVLISTLSKLELSILRYYIVHALQTGRQDKVLEFFAMNGNYLLQRREEWIPWFAIPYIKNPSLDPQFRVYFSKDWFDALQLSFHNILSEIFNGTRIPALLKISTEKNAVKRLETDIKNLNQKLSELQALLEKKESEILRLRSTAATVVQERNSVDCPSHDTTLKDIGNNLLREGSYETTTFNDSHTGIRNVGNGGDASISAKAPHDLADVSSISLNRLSSIDTGSQGASQMFLSETRREVLKEDEFPEVAVEFQETFLGHTNPISRCRFSASGTNVASASVDGTVRIWTYGSSTPASRNATIYCGAEIMSLEWECRSDRLVF